MVKTTVLILIFFFLHTFYLYAGTTGKISGRVTDKTTNQPLVGVNIIVEGKYLGAATNADGYYFVINISPGIYSVSATMIGHGTKVKTNVKVSADRTTFVNFDLTEEVLEVGKVIVVAERPLIQKDVTAKATIIEAEAFAEMPITNFQGALATQAGFTTDENNEIHVRGGRSGEVAYMIDGIYVRDPYSGGFGSQLDKYSIKELQIITGGFNAEYGQAMSGVINIVTKEGGSDYNGRFEYETLRLNESPYRKPDWMLETDITEGLHEEGKLSYQDELRDSLDMSKYKSPDYSQRGEPEYMPIAGNFSANFSGPVPFVKKLTFFMSDRYYNSKGYLPWGYNKRRELNAKLTYRLNLLKMNFFVQRNLREWKPYSHRWKYNPDGYEHRKSKVEREGIIITHTINTSTFYEARFSRFERKYDLFLPGKWAEFDFNKNTGGYELISSNYERSDDIGSNFYYKGDHGTIDDRDIITYTGKVDLISQISLKNLLKTGIEIIQHEIFRETYIQPWEGENHRYEKFTRKPIELSFYMQDKLEHEYFIINMGLRYDYSNPELTMWPDLDVPGYIDESGDWVASEEISVEPKTQISPRFGIGFPVTERTVFYSSYGHFYQIPSYLEMYGTHKVDEDRPLIGNPNINPQKTVAFETGVKQQIGSDYALDFSIYFKDIINLAGSTYHGFFPYEYTLYDNSDYASVNGTDVTLTKRFSHYFSASLNYSYSIAKGNESDPREGYNDYKRANFPLRPKRLFYLDFDRRHDMSFNVNICLPEKFGPGLLGLQPLGNIQFNILFEAASGLPYTPQVEEAGESLQEEKNSAHRPAIYNLDLKILKKVKVRHFSLTGFLVIRNLFDRRNAVNVWRRTGLPWDNGPYTSYSNDRVFNPENVSEPRRISVGLRLDL